MASQDTEDLPRTNVRRIIKGKLTELGQKLVDDDGKKKDVQINKDTLLAFCESAKIFVHYISATANEICHENKRQTINADDVLRAVEDLDFPEFSEPLRVTLEAFRKENQTKKSEAKGKKPPGKKRKVEDGEDGGRPEGDGGEDPGTLEGLQREDAQERFDDPVRRDLSSEKEHHHDAISPDRGEESGPEQYQEESPEGYAPDNRDAEGSAGEERGVGSEEEFDPERDEAEDEDALMPAENENVFRGSTGAGILHAENSPFYRDGGRGHDMPGGLGRSDTGFPESHY